MADIHFPVIPIIFKGIQFGVVLAFLVGPIFFTILQTSIERGFFKGVLVTIGVSISDTLYVIICYFGLAPVMAHSNVKVYMGYGGGAILVAFGLYQLLVKSRAKPDGPVGTTVERNPYQYVLKGFIINGMTPTVLFFWIATASVATIDFGYADASEFTFFFASLLMTVLATDILKAYLAARLRMLVTSRLLLIMNIVLGVGMIIFGCRLMWIASTLTLA
jgi:threonine/homoserine/homoserine lactone efflux protein